MNVMLSINAMATPGKIPQGDPRWSTFNDSFVPRDLPPHEIASAIGLGHAYAAVHQGRRCLENFIAAQHIAVDMDSGDERSSFDSLLQHDLVKMHGGLIHTTPSHTADAPRARVIFFLDSPITDAQQFQAAAKFLVSQFDGADGACTDASRFFYGATDCDIWLPDGDNVLPVRQLRRYWRKWHKTQPQTPAERPGVVNMESYRQTQNAAQNAPTRATGYNFAAILDPVRSAVNGTRNVTLQKQAFFAGKDVRDGKVSESIIAEELIRAGLAIGLDEAEVRRVVRNNIRDGIAKGRVA